MKDADAIRYEIEQTAQRIDDTLAVLGRRTREAGTTALRWTLIAGASAAAIAAVAGVYLWRRGGMRRRRRVVERDAARPLPFDRVGSAQIR